MIRPSQVAFYSKKAEKQNFRFRLWLKGNADSKDLDKQFLILHEELFSVYDCSRCRNCCKQYPGGISEEDLEKDALLLHMSIEEFKDKYLVESNDPDNAKYITKHTPCDFLTSEGVCLLEENKPKDCLDYPYTNRPDRMGSLLSFLDAVSVCPIAYEICERLKEHYHFR